MSEHAFPTWVIGKKRSVEAQMEVENRWLTEYEPVPVLRRKVLTERGFVRSPEQVTVTETHERRRIEPRLPNKATVKLVKRLKRKPRFVSHIDHSKVDPRVYELGIIPRPE